MNNVNCGVLGHIDSGKTSLCRAMHETASTASMDKHPQSQERGITLDLGFSSFWISAEKLATLVDCPGHASLIKTVIGAAQILDVCLLVLDAQKGFQAQTAECLVVAEIVTSALIVVVNKIDLVVNKDMTLFQKQYAHNITKALSKTRFSQDIPIAFVSATTGHGLDSLVAMIDQVTSQAVKRSVMGPFHLSFDHCFLIKGQGTVFTGTILSGVIRKGQRLLLPDTGETSDIRSIQVFRDPAESACQGDRVGICIPGISRSGKERGDLYSTDAHVLHFDAYLLVARKIKYYKGILGVTSFHVSVGHHTAIGKPYYIRVRSSSPAVTGPENPKTIVATSLNSGHLLRELDEVIGRITNSIRDPASELDFISDIDSMNPMEQEIVCLLLLDRKIRCLEGSLAIASRLDLDAEHSGCRIALFGRVYPIDLSAMRERVTKSKTKFGDIDRQCSEKEYLVRGLCKKGSGDIQKLIGQQVFAEGGPKGIIESSFGMSGLVRVRFDDTLGFGAIGQKVYFTSRKPALKKILDAHRK